MTARAKFTAIWAAILMIAWGLAVKFEGDYRDLAARLDLKILTLEVKGSGAVIPHMNDWRNANRAAAKRLEAAVVALGVAAGVAAIAAAVTGFAWWALALSLLGAGAAAFFALMAAGVVPPAYWDAALGWLQAAWAWLAAL